MEHTKKEREGYNKSRQRACDVLGITINRYNAYRRLGAELHKIYENNCNGELTEAAYEAAVTPLYVATERMAAQDGLHIFFQTDPRGATVYLDKKEIPDNNYTQAKCIY